MQYLGKSHPRGLFYEYVEGFGPIIWTGAENAWGQILEALDIVSVKIWSATFSKILQASELLGTNVNQFYMEKDAFDQILESGTSSPSLSLWGHLNSLIEAAGQFFLYWVIIQPVLVVCTLFQSHITTRSEIKAKIRFCIYTISHITIEPTVG